MKKILVLISFQLIFFITMAILPSVAIKERLYATNLPEATNKIFNLDQNIFFTVDYPHHNLSQISLELKNPGLINDQIYTIDIFDHQNQLLQQLSFSDRSVGDPSRLDLKFPTINVDSNLLKIIISPSENRQLPTLSTFLDRQGKPLYQLFGYQTRFNPKQDIGNFLSRIPLTYIFLLLFFNLYLIINYVSKK